MKRRPKLRVIEGGRKDPPPFFNPFFWMWFWWMR